MNFRCFVLSILSCMSLSLLAPRALVDYSLVELMALTSFFEPSVSLDRSFSSASPVSRASSASAIVMGSPTKTLRRGSSSHSPVLHSPLSRSVSPADEPERSALPPVVSPRAFDAPMADARLVRLVTRALKKTIKAVAESQKRQDLSDDLDDLVMDGAGKSELREVCKKLVARGTGSSASQESIDEDEAILLAVENAFNSPGFKAVLEDAIFCDRFI